MSYQYEAERPRLFSEDGLLLVVKIRDNVRELLSTAGAFSASKAWKNCSGDAWQMMAALDYLCERNEIYRLTPKGSVAGQHEVFTK